MVVVAVLVVLHSTTISSITTWGPYHGGGGAVDTQHETIYIYIYIIYIYIYICFFVSKFADVDVPSCT